MRNLLRTALGRSKSILLTSLGSAPVLLAIVAPVSVLLPPCLARAEIMDLAAGQQKILSFKVGGPTTVTNPKAVKVMIEKGSLHVIGRSPGTAEILTENPRRSIEVVVYSTKLIEGRKAVGSWLKNTFGLHLEVFPDRLMIHGTVLRLKDWMDLQRLRKQFRSLDTDARLAPRVAVQLRQAVEAKLKERSFFASQTRIQDNHVQLTSNSTDKNDQESMKDLADQFGLDAPQNTHNVELRPMIEVEVVIAEMKKNVMRSLGLQLPGSYSATIIPSGDLSWASTAFNPITPQLNAQENKDWGRVLANPKLLCRSGEAAHFVAGGQIPIKLIAWRQADVTWKPYGVILDIVPLADMSGAISTKLVTEISLLDEAHKVDGIPGLLTNRIETRFDLRGSKTIALSGLIKSELGKNVSETPLLSSIPILGELFKSRDYKDNRTELVVFVTPRVVSPDNPPPPPAPPAWLEDD